MFRDKGQRTNEVHVKHVTTFTFAAHAALAADKALNHPSALAELQPVGIDDDEGERSCVLLACFCLNPLPFFFHFVSDFEWPRA